MTDHDPMCPVVHSAIECGYCVLIARVRADERERWRKPCECPIAFHEAEVRERIRAQVEALPVFVADMHNGTGPHYYEHSVLLSEVLALLDGEPNG